MTEDAIRPVLRVVFIMSIVAVINSANGNIIAIGAANSLIRGDLLN